MTRSVQLAVLLAEEVGPVWRSRQIGAQVVAQPRGVGRVDVVAGTGQAVEKARAAGLGVLVGSMMEHPHSVAAALRFASLLGGVHDLDAGWWARDTSPLRYRDGIVSVEQ